MSKFMLNEQLEKFLPKSIMAQLRKRSGAFESREQMELTAIAMSEQARLDLEMNRDQRWKRASKAANRSLLETGQYNEAIIGGGLHAAIYCAIRVAMGYPRPLVIEQGRVGGIFAVSHNASFNLNSRNRPGEYAGMPSENAALNVVPGAPIQMQNLSSREFQSNADLSFVIRSTLARSADILFGQVTNVRGADYRPWTIELADGRLIGVDRVIDSRGLGAPQPLFNAEGSRRSEQALDFVKFMQKMDDTFPLAGMKRVAVVGNGDSARVVIEALLGVGPEANLSVPMLDWIEQVDWYGPTMPTTCDGWREQERGRYQGIGSFLRPLENGVQRLRVFNQNGYATDGYKVTYVNGRTYDTVINCTGWVRELLGSYLTSPTNYYGTQPRLACQFGYNDLYGIGPSAQIPFEADESVAVRRIPANAVALFRLGGRTAALAQQLT